MGHFPEFFAAERIFRNIRELSRLHVREERERRMGEKSSGPSSSEGDGLGEASAAPDGGSRQGICSRCWQFTLTAAPAMFGIVLAFAGYELLRSNAVSMGRMIGIDPYDSLHGDNQVPEDAKALFMGYDMNLDGQISMEEFMYLYPQLIGEEGANTFAVSKTVLVHGCICCIR